jgi:calcium/calmodulin-dependent protein kinase I
LYAVKIIQRAGLQPKDDEAVLNEVAVMQSLTGDKYVVQVLDFYEEDDYFYVVMEYYAGGDVFDRIVKLVHYTEYDARALAIVLLKAVDSIHENGIAHRDIKPQVRCCWHRATYTSLHESISHVFVCWMIIEFVPLEHVGQYEHSGG